MPLEDGNVKRIRRIVNEYVKYLEDKDITFDSMEELVSQYNNVEIISEEMEELSKIVFSDDMYEMHLNKRLDDYINPKNFTIAHEIGHIILHDEDIQKGAAFCRSNFSYDPDDLKELEADQFAAELLMPAKEVLRILKENEYNISEKAVNEVKEKARISAISSASAKTRLITIKKEAYFFGGI